MLEWRNLKQYLHLAGIDVRNLTLKICNEENQFEPIQKLISVIEIRVYEYLKLQNKMNFKWLQTKITSGRENHITERRKWLTRENNFHREKMAFEEKRKNFEEEKIKCCRRLHGLRREKKMFWRNRSAGEKRTWLPKISVGICSTFWYYSSTGLLFTMRIVVNII